LQPPNTFPGSEYTKTAFAAGKAKNKKTCLLNLEQRERVWWLQMSFSPDGGANGAEFEGNFEAEERGEK